MRSLNIYMKYSRFWMLAVSWSLGIPRREGVGIVRWLERGYVAGTLHSHVVYVVICTTCTTIRSVLRDCLEAVFSQQVHIFEFEYMYIVWGWQRGKVDGDGRGRCPPSHSSCHNYWKLIYFFSFFKPQSKQYDYGPLSCNLSSESWRAHIFS